MKKKLSENPRCFEDAANRLESAGVPFAWISIFSSDKSNGKKIFLAFYLELFELCQKQRIVIEDDKLVIRNGGYMGSYDKLQSQMDDIFVEFIKGNFGFSGDGASDIISFHSMQAKICTPQGHNTFLSGI